jgi:MtrB/PioB family decaheme-associated outer membrane protein
MDKRLIPLLVGSLFAATTAAAADDDEMSWSGSSISIGVRSTSQTGGTRNGASASSSTVTGPAAPLIPFTGTEDLAKANEYRDLSSGVIGTIDLVGTSKQNYLRFFGENLGYSDQYLNLRGGSYGDYKYQLFDDRMPHNLSWSALTPLVGTGGSTLTYPGVTPGVTSYPPTGPVTDPNTWNRFNYELKREVIGGNFEYQFNPQWYTRFGYNETTMQGIRPSGGRLGTSSSNGMIEFGAPTDYRTKDFTFDVGYSTKESSFSVNYLNSTFTNPNPFMQWTNFFMLNNLDTTTLPPDNALNRVALNGTLRNLPVKSTLAIRATWSELSNNFGVTSGGLMPTNNVLNPATTGSPQAVGNLITQPNRDTFVGDVETKTASVSFTSSPSNEVDTKIFYNYYDSKNKSTLIQYAQGFLGTGPCPASSFPSSSTATQFCIGPTPNSLFSYTKSDYGLEALWRATRANKLSGGVNWSDISREGRDDAPKTDYTNLWAEFKNSSLETLSGRLKYVYTQRRSQLDPSQPVGNTPGTVTTPGQVPYYFVAYDVSNANINAVKLMLDWAPAPLFDTTFETAYKQTQYKDLNYGRTQDQRQEYNLTVSYGDPKGFRVTALFNFELVEFNQKYHQGTGPLPGGPQTPTDFDWSTKNTQTNQLWGFMADWAATEQVALKGSYTWTRTGGGVDFNSGNTAGAGGFNGGPLVNYVTDNTKKQTLNLKGDYKFDRQWSATLGYVWEKYDYNDDQMKGYQGFYPYYQYLGGNNSSWFSGAFANPAYKVQVVYLVGTYKF